MSEICFSVHSDMENTHIMDMHTHCKLSLLPRPWLFTSEWNVVRKEPSATCQSFGKGFGWKRLQLVAIMRAGNYLWISFICVISISGPHSEFVSLIPKKR